MRATKRTVHTFPTRKLTDGERAAGWELCPASACPTIAKLGTGLSPYAPHAHLTTYAVRVSESTCCAVQLDSAENVDGMGLAEDAVRMLKRGAVVTATLAQLEAFADFLHPRAISDDLEPRHRRTVERDRERILALVKESRRQSG